MKKNSVNIVVISNLSERNILYNSFNTMFQQYKDEYIMYYCHFTGSIDKKTEEMVKRADITIVWISFFYDNEDICLSLIDKKVELNCVQRKAEIFYSNIFDNVIKKTNRIIISITDTNYFNIEQSVYGPIQKFSNFIDKLNYELFSKYYNDIVFINTNEVISRIGVTRAITRRALHKWGILYTSDYTNELVIIIHKIYQMKVGKNPKCIVVDCDNVLWKGIIQEDGPEGILLASEGEGKPYKSFQRLLVFLYNNGIIIAICSKNNLNDIMEVFENNKEMLLKKEMISVFKVNWNGKAANISEIAEELNIDINSIVFVDDDEYEIAQVTKEHPQVTAIQFNINNYSNIFEKYMLPIGTDYEENMSRQRVYYENQIRKNHREICNNDNDYLLMLGTQTRIEEAKRSELNRISELSYRTNKCTNGGRFSGRELMQWYENKDVDIYSVYVNDNFGELGLVGSFAVRESCVILFTLSCRALGRNVEKNMIDFIREKYCHCMMLFRDSGKNYELYELVKKEMLVKEYE